jgi:lipopolysaccharide transport system permease protein
MNQTTHKAIFSVTGNASLLRKTYMPKYIFTLAKISSGLIDLCFSLGALVIVMFATGAAFSWYALLFPFVIFQVYVFCVGLGLFLAQANVFFRDIQYIYNAVTTAWLYISCIFYPLEMLPDWLQWVITHLNPMYFYIAQFRAIIHEGVFPDLWFVFAGIGAAFISLIFGAFTFLRAKDRFILYI